LHLHLAALFAFIIPLLPVNMTAGMLYSHRRAYNVHETFIAPRLQSNLLGGKRTNNEQLIESVISSKLLCATLPRFSGIMHTIVGLDYSIDCYSGEEATQPVRHVSLDNGKCI
jgi:hypothetical protein